MTERPHRDTIALEDARVLSHEAHPGSQQILRLAAPECARDARPGQFVHLRCDPRLALRRPLSIMRADPGTGSIELLYKVVGEGTRRLATRRPGETLSLLGPIGRPFALHRERPRPLLIGGGVGMPPMVFLADALRGEAGWRPFAILGSEVPFPFDPRPAQQPVIGLPAEAGAVMPLLEDWGIPNRLSSGQGFPGCFRGYVSELAEHWLAALDASARAEVEVFACGPHPMLAAVADLARRWGLPCQVSLEEYMACGVGGCAGCVVEVRTAEATAMKRVCVDGPVFEADEVFFQAET
ncbi:2-polyprenylphenol hydroxylase-like oxidoreductase [Thioflavicoccus mobilis 8321]|uniref:2-polyprenylphenol hydroxylase-like oxidoreductase n=1 Tax=Thioflavicoccus mobilis 8321 TaxID=765912 RepID=L0GZP1_9GAMM|nr:dihydroorotate dehydrogenase electron transfer subunit [Thioflavicoccus mobilis]AGA91282.1 2-polyprenylphenol hydroxylase-like oxidoreductase [Thioflavicoccus mobilis 8321]